MIWLWQGIVLGLTLSVLAGPMMFLFLQLGVERGFRAGIAAAAGAWTSDFFYVLGAYLGISYLLRLAQWSGFQLWMGIIGGFILIISGLSTLFTRQQSADDSSRTPTSRLTYFGLFFKGFLINTFNPFAAFFWLSVVSAASATGKLTAPMATVFFSAIMGTIILTDLVKIFLAKRIKPWLNHHKLAYFRRFSALALIVFGIVLLARVLVVSP